MKPEEETLKQLLMLIVLLLRVLLPPLIAAIAIGCFGVSSEKNKVPDVAQTGRL
jgi:hypothetical protein